MTGPVVDQANLLSPSTEADLTSLILAHQDSTSNQLAVLTIPSLDGEVLEEYSLKVARGWQLGTAGNNNGVLILIAVAERSVRIEVGYGLEGNLPDISAKRIIDNVMIPLFRQDNFEVGILEGVTTTIAAIEGSYSPQDLLTDGQFVEGFMLAAIPILLACAFILQPASSFWVMMLFMLPLLIAGGHQLFPPYGAYVFPLALFFVLISVRTYLKKSSKWGPIVTAIEQASPGDTVPIVVAGKTFKYRIPQKSRSRGASSSRYRGGGGSFGGGGASGRW